LCFSSDNYFIHNLKLVEKKKKLVTGKDDDSQGLFYKQDKSVQLEIILTKITRSRNIEVEEVKEKIKVGGVEEIQKKETEEGT
jgi:hypothetical protein